MSEAYNPPMSELHALLDDSVALLQALIRIPSPNPPGNTQQIAYFIGLLLNSIGATACMYAPQAKPEATSVVGTMGSGDPVIMLHAHIDTVPIAANEASRWTVDPYAAEIRDGKLYGKGSIDDKAPLAAMLHTFAQVAKAPDAHGTLVIVAAAEEETGGVLGTKWLAESKLLPACDFIVVGEQTANRAANAHKGVMRAAVRAVGRSVHATNPDRGVNAIVAMTKAVLALDTYHQSLKARVHPQVGFPTCNVGVIQGGSTANAVPDSCAVFLDRRMIPGENPETVKQELIDVIASVDAGAAQLSVGDFQVSNWYASTVEGDLAQTFLKSVQQEIGGDLAPVGYLPGSDAKHLTGCLRPGGEMIIFGPGSYEVAHAFDEYTDVADLAATARILRRFIGQAFQMTEGGVA
ncbi:MAG: M20/M25/M40 family metallo-hydrolase [Chloroflexi bacterium]|nr:M20/M25/M40 family metallo-hydrolase [Chloroflexota bacterium]